MRIHHLIPFALLCIVVASCNSNHSMEQYLATADSTELKDISSLNSPSRKILHSADVHYRVASVLTATSQAEQLVKAVGGMVVKSEMRTEIMSVKDMPYTADSLKRTQVYIPVAQLTLKVPVAKSDSVMQQLGAMAQFTSSRIISQQDVTFSYLSNAMKNEKAEKQKTVAASQTSVLSTTPEAIAQKDARDENIVDRRIENLQILDEVDYATITIAFVQPEQVDFQIIVDPDYATRTPFGTELLMALNGGADILKNILLFFVHLWPIWIMAVCGVFLYHYLRRQPIILPKRS